MFIESVELDTDTVNLDLSGVPNDERGASGDTSLVHQQTVWPKLEVSVALQPELIAGRIGEAVNGYQSKLQLASAALNVDGFGVEFEPQQARGNRFKMTFRLKVIEATDGES
jgi:hypothetical protein